MPSVVSVLLVSVPSVPSPLLPKPPLKSALLFESINFYTSLTRARFKELCQDFFHSTLKPVEKIFRDSKIGEASVHKGILVGSSICIPYTVKLVFDFFNYKEPCKSINPDEAVAYSAVGQAVIPSFW